jgi:hypothetical protein
VRSRTRGRHAAVTGLLAALTVATTVAAGPGPTPAPGPAPPPVSFEQRTVPAGDGPIALSAADFDHDGNRDLAVANLLSNDVSVLPGDGKGFRPGARLPSASSRTRLR